MRKNYIYLLLLLFSTIMFGQKVTLTPTVVNGSNVNNGPINLGGSISSTISLNVKVETPTNSPDNGTISIYYEKSPALGANIARGGNGVFLNFGGGKIGIINFIIYLDSADFNTSGGNIYAEYKNYAGVTYKSSSIAVIKDGISPPPPPVPYKYYEIVPYGGIPILPLFHEYSYVASQEWVSGEQIIPIPLGTPFYQGADLREKTTFNDGGISYSGKISFHVVNFLSQFDNLYVNNKITSNQYLTAGQVPDMIIGNEPTESHTIKVTSGGRQRDQTVRNSLKSYNIQWQSRIKYPSTWNNMSAVFFSMYGWRDISGATQMNYLPPQTNTGMEYRRLILEDPNDKSSYRRCAASNVIEIIPLIANAAKNTVCCDQTVSSGNLANPLNGDFYNFSYYQWLVSQDNVNWNPIQNGTTQNYTPIPLMGDTHTTSNFQIQYYKRILLDYEKSINYTSNTVQINFEYRAISTNESIKIFPNPATSIINIEDTNKRTYGGSQLEGASIIITNSFGNIVNSNNFTLVNSTLATVNISNLPAAIYIVNISQNNRIIYTGQFIKN